MLAHVARGWSACSSSPRRRPAESRAVRPRPAQRAHVTLPARSRSAPPRTGRGRATPGSPRRGRLRGRRRPCASSTATASSGYDSLHVRLHAGAAGRRPWRLDPQVEYEYDFVGGDRRRPPGPRLRVRRHATTTPIHGHRQWRQRNVTMVGGGHSLCVDHLRAVPLWKKSPAGPRPPGRRARQRDLPMSEPRGRRPRPRSRGRAARSGRSAAARAGSASPCSPASLGWQLARLGKRVVLVDADLGRREPAHLPRPARRPRARWATSSCGAWSASRTWWWRRRFPRLRLISGASDFLGAANIKHQQKVRVLNRIRALDVDIVLIDLGAGTSLQHHRLLPDLGRLAAGGGAGADLDRERLPLHQERALPPPARGWRRPRPCARSWTPPSTRRTRRASARRSTSWPRWSARPRRRWTPLRRELAAFHPRFVVNQVRGAGGRRDRPPAGDRLRAPPRHPRHLRGLRALRRRRVAGGAPAAAVRGRGSRTAGRRRRCRQLARGLLQGEAWRSPG